MTAPRQPSPQEPGGEAVPIVSQEDLRYRREFWASLARQRSRRKRRFIGCNDQGYRVGSSHPKVKLTDEMVSYLRTLHEEKGLGWRRLARITGLPAWTVKDILSWRRRLQVPTQWKRDDEEAEAQE